MIKSIYYLDKDEFNTWVIRNDSSSMCLLRQGVSESDVLKEIDDLNKSGHKDIKSEKPERMPLYKKSKSALLGDISVRNSRIRQLEEMVRVKDLAVQEKTGIIKGLEKALSILELK